MWRGIRRPRPPGPDGRLPKAGSVIEFRGYRTKPDTSTGTGPDVSSSQDTWDLIVLGAGSGGIGAALAAARLGLRTLLVEEWPAIGGVAVHGGVNVWEPGVGGTGIPHDIYRRLRQTPDAVGIYSFGRHCCWPGANKPPFPGGELLVDPERSYADTLRRHGSRGLAQDEAFVRKYWHGVVFEPDAYSSAVAEMLRETGLVEVRTGAALAEVDCVGGRLESVMLADRTRLRSGAWIDATNTGALCRACGARVAPRAAAPLNAVSLIYRITPAAPARIEPLPAGLPSGCWWQASFPLMSCVEYPNRDRSCNMLPTMSAEECLALGPRAAYQECERRVRAHWRWVQQEYPEFRGYRIARIAPRLGIRETVHLECEYMLCKDDLLKGLPGQNHPDIIALADHAMDSHGQGAGCTELARPYGIPFRSLEPKGLQNVLISSMAAGFTSEAATSCRLSRTIMQLGQAAGTAAALASRLGLIPREAPVEQLRKALADQRVRLDWPFGGH